MPLKKDAKQLAREEQKAKAAQMEEKKPKKKKKKKDDDEDKKEVEVKIIPPKPMTVELYETSIYDLLQSIEKMQEYDFMLLDLELISGCIDEELLKEGKIEPPPESVIEEVEEVQPEKEESEDEGSNYYSNQEEEEVEAEPEVTPEPSVHNLYSDDDEYEEIVS